MCPGQRLLQQQSGDKAQLVKPLSWAKVCFAAFLLVFIPAALPQEKPCCSITGIDTRAGLVSAKVNTTGQSFQFKPNTAALLASMKVGEGVYANFKTGKVSLDGKAIAGTIVSLGPAQRPLPPAAPSKAPSPPPAPQPGTSPRAASGSTSQVGPGAACCGITSIDARAQLVAAKVNSTGQRFEFSVPDSVPIQSLHAGQPVWANFKTGKVSFDGRTACCDIVSLGNTSVGPTGEPTLESAQVGPGKPGGGRPLLAGYREIDPCTITSADTLKTLLQAGIQNYFPIAMDNGGEHMRITNPNVEQVICPHMMIKVHTAFGYSQTRGLLQFQTGGSMELQSSLVVEVTFAGGGPAMANAPITASNLARAAALLTNPQITSLQVDNIPSWIDLSWLAACLNGAYSNWGCTDVLHAMSFDVTDLVRLYLQQGNTLPASPQAAAVSGQLPIVATRVGKPAPAAAPVPLQQATAAATAKPTLTTTSPAAQPAPGVATFANLPTPASLMVTPASVTGGASPTGTVALTGAAPQSGVQIKLASSNVAVATVPQSVMVDAGASTATFTVSTNPVPLTLRPPTSFPVPVVISATGARGPTQVQTVTQTATLNVLPPVVELLGEKASSTLTKGFPCGGPSDFPFKGKPITFSQTGGDPLDGCVLLSGRAADESRAQAPDLRFEFLPGAPVLLSSNNPQIGAVPPLVVVPVGNIAATFGISTVPVKTPTTVVISGHRTKSDTKSMELTVLPPVLQDFQCNPQSVTGGTDFSCTITLSGPAYDGLIVPLCWDPLGTYPPLPSRPNDVPFPFLASSANLNVHTLPVAQDISFQITACFSAVSKTVPLTVMAPRPRLLTLDPNPVQGGNPSTGTVTLKGLAPAGGIDVALSANPGGVARVPANVHVAAGMSSASFTLTTQTVTTQQGVTVSASYAGTTVSSILTVQPSSAPCGGFFLLSLNPTSFLSIPPTGATVTATVSLGSLGPAPQAGATVNISQVANPPATGGPGANYPNTVTVPPQECGVTFAIRVYPCSPQYASCTNAFQAQYMGQSSNIATVFLPMAGSASVGTHDLHVAVRRVVRTVQRAHEIGRCLAYVRRRERLSFRAAKSPGGGREGV